MAATRAAETAGDRGAAAAGLVLVANTRFPSRRAQALQVAQASAAFQRAGAPTTLIAARRRGAVELPPGTDPFTWYGVGPGPRPALELVDCIDWIDRVPRALQYAPARLQELSFARNAARRVLAAHADAWVLAREIECTLRLVRAGSRSTFLEIHRVPAGGTRRRWLLEAARGARGIVAISGGVRADLVALGIPETAITVEHDGFEPARFAARPSRAEARRALALPEGAPLVAYTGGLLAWKGVDVLVEAARLVPEVYFVIAGGLEADVARVRAQAGGLANVRVDGFQPPERVPWYLAAADLGVVPNRSRPAISARYTSPLKVFESMAVGLPLVASDLPSLAELLRRDVDALLVAPDDPRALADGIARLVADPALRTRLATNLAARAPEHTWDARARRLLEWMREKLRDQA
ncbi:MAG: glycosyltransferase family 4 protein [Planctomycetes bacterium]|nr:glycosyltransferase family 4 protein [Planctomycetota bacterium]